MIRIISFILLFLPSCFLAKSNTDKSLILRRVSQKIALDGIAEAVWQSADSSSGFTQMQPYYGQPSSFKTIVKILSTDNALYCLMICHEPQDMIQQNKGSLDNVTGDIVSIMLDTFGNERTGYRFAVSATGVRSDCRMLDDGRNFDYSWDGIWFAASKIYEWGFIIEIRIPYKSIQFNSSLESWGLDFDRWIPAKTEDTYWCNYEESEGLRISKFGQLKFTEFRPQTTGLNLEIYPVGLLRSNYLRKNRYNLDPDAGLDILYNPSYKLNFQLTANPDFAQIEADPYEFNISRYESYFDERRPFFTEGSEIFKASGKQRNTGFYSPLELFYSRRIGKILPDGQQVPLFFGTKAFGRLKTWEYGGFVALTGERKYFDEEQARTEEKALFVSARIKKQILNNSSIGLLLVGKHTRNNNNGVLDIDGAFRTAKWQLAYQLARSYTGSTGDYGGSAGFTSFGENWLTLVRGRYIGANFEVNQVGFVPWKGTAELVAITGPRWYFKKGKIRQILFYAGPTLYYEKIDKFTDRGMAAGFNMQFRNNWGYEINMSVADSREEDIRFNYYDVSLSSWFNVSPKWEGSLYTGYARTYNFDRDFLAYYNWSSGEIGWYAFKTLKLGTSLGLFFEGNPSGAVEDITLNSRPFLSATPVNNLNVRIYIDNLFYHSTDHMEQMIFGFLFSYNFSPKSWIYFAINEVRDRSERLNEFGNPLPSRLHVTDRVSVLKVKYLHYF
ncbi:MAG: hydrolase [Calditrichaeota bacterium]|nr:carbohydrate binding family 9 domain-containing protein [Calditrichota bacterium]RQV99758.1 MAG: hydrolase [Calditrichota bacterium]